MYSAVSIVILWAYSVLTALTLVRMGQNWLGNNTLSGLFAA